MSNLKHAFSIDLEDWYQGIELDQNDWKGKEYRLDKGLDVLLELLTKTDTKGTFFCLGWIADKYPNVIKKISSFGHEVQSHGFAHEKVYNITKDEFREDLRSTKGKIEDLTGSKVIGHRSPFFSITKKSLWALEILKEEGFLYDCSISPVVTWRYGIEGSPNNIYEIKDFGLIEFPVSTIKFLHKQIGVGGAYFRIFPYLWFKNFFRNEKTFPKMFYAHPWEFDPNHPNISIEWKAKLTHYFNIKNMEKKTQKLLENVDFTTVWDAINWAKKENQISEVTIEELRAGQM